MWRLENERQKFGFEFLGTDNVFVWCNNTLNKIEEDKKNDLIKRLASGNKINSPLGEIEITEPQKILTTNENFDILLAHYNYQQKIIRKFLLELSIGNDPQIPQVLGQLGVTYPTLNTKYSPSFNNYFRSDSDKTTYKLLESAILSIFDLKEKHPRLLIDNRLARCLRCNSFYFKPNKSSKICGYKEHNCYKLNKDPEYKKDWYLDQKEFVENIESYPYSHIKTQK